MENIILYLHR